MARRRFPTSSWARSSTASRASSGLQHRRVPRLAHHLAHQPLRTGEWKLGDPGLRPLELLRRSTRRSRSQRRARSGAIHTRATREDGTAPVTGQPSRSAVGSISSPRRELPLGRSARRGSGRAGSGRRRRWLEVVVEHVPALAPVDECDAVTMRSANSSCSPCSSRARVGRDDDRALMVRDAVVVRWSCAIWSPSCAWDSPSAWSRSSAVPPAARQVVAEQVDRGASALASSGRSRAGRAKSPL